MTRAHNVGKFCKGTTDHEWAPLVIEEKNPNAAAVLEGSSTSRRSFLLVAPRRSKSRKSSNLATRVVPHRIRSSTQPIAESSPPSELQSHCPYRHIRSLTVFSLPLLLHLTTFVTICLASQSDEISPDVKTVKEGMFTASRCPEPHLANLHCSSLLVVSSTAF